MMAAFLLGWLAWFAPWDDLLDRKGTPLGADFSMFYVAGRLVLEGQATHLYDQAAHQQRLHTLFPGIDPRFCLPYRYPPFVASAMAPLAALPYGFSFLVFSLLSLTAACGAVAALTTQFSLLRGDWRQPLLWALAGWPVFWETLLGGQASVFGLAVLSCGVVLLAREQYVWSGVVFALAAYKPNLMALVVLGCVIRYPRMLWGLVPTLSVLGLCSLLPAGEVGLWDYVRASGRLAAGVWDVETPLWKLHSLAPWFAPLLPASARFWSLAVGAAAAIAVGLTWRRAERALASRSSAAANRSGPDSISANRRDSGGRPSGGSSSRVFPFAVALLIGVNALFNPYTPIYDLLLLAVAGLAVAEGLWREHRAPRFVAAQIGLAAVYWGPHISQSLAQRTHVQLFTLALAMGCAWLAALFVRAVCSRPFVAAIPALARWAEG